MASRQRVNTFPDPLSALSWTKSPGARAQVEQISAHYRDYPPSTRVRLRHCCLMAWLLIISTLGALTHNEIVVQRRVTAAVLLERACHRLQLEE